MSRDCRRCFLRWSFRSLEFPPASTDHSDGAIDSNRAGMARFTMPRKDAMTRQSLGVTRLEDRVLPSITPNDVFAAITQTLASAELLRMLGGQLGMPRSDLSKQYTATVLPIVQAQAEQSMTVLGQFRQALQQQQHARPELAGFLAPYVDATKRTEHLAMLNAGYAGLYAAGFRADLARRNPVPATVPPPSSPASPTNMNTLFNPDGSLNLQNFPGLNSGSDSNNAENSPATPTPAATDSNSMGMMGISSTIPDLLAPEWQNFGNGLRIWDVVIGTGAVAQAGQTVTVHYVGWLMDGSTFDSSVARGVPSTFSLNQVIQGWQQGIPGMKVGGIRRLDIPAPLAYGNNPPPGSSIPPNARLIFEVQLLAIL